MHLIHKLFPLAVAACLTACSTTAQPTAMQPDVSPRQDAGAPFVIAANPLAADAGVAVLKRGGSAADAAVAVQAMLSLVEPQSSGVGGGAFMTYFDGRTRKIVVYDGRETAPAQATAGMFLGPDGKALPFDTAVLSGRATGVPGAVKMLALAHREHGRLPWNSLFGDAQRTASEGFSVSPRLARLIHADWAENKVKRGAPIRRSKKARQRMRSIHKTEH
jgi:gamma-glutamyltranspeptidase/glutathione hydrolase